MFLMRLKLIILRAMRRFMDNAGHISKLFGSEKWFLKFSHAGVVLTGIIFTVIMSHEEGRKGHV